MAELFCPRCPRTVQINPANPPLRCPDCGGPLEKLKEGQSGDLRLEEREGAE